jgi:hypothetical protein
MRAAIRRFLILAVLVGLAPFLSACGLAANSGNSGGQASSPANPGERPGTVPTSAVRQAPPAHPAASPQQAVERFASSYINWTWQSLASDQAALAASAVGEARASEEQARRQTARDAPLQRAEIYNRGVIVAVARLHGGQPDEWVIDTREQTGGNGEYAGLQTAFHITLAAVARVRGGWAVSAWRPVE